MKEIRTTSGFECYIDATIFNDVEILDMILEVEDGNTLQFARLMKTLLGKEQYLKAKDFIRNEEGKATTEDLYKLFGEIFVEIGKSEKN